MDNDKAQKIVDEAMVQYEKMRNTPLPKFPFWLLCKLIWITARRKRQIDRVQLGPPYRITYKDEIAA